MSPFRRRAGVAFVFALVAFGSGAAAAPAPSATGEELPTAEEIVARSKIAAATDRRPETERELWDVRLASLEGTSSTLRRGADIAQTTELGPFRTARGTRRGEKWRQNENGETILERAEPSQTERIATQNVTRVREPVNAFEVTTAYAGGHVTRSFYDTRSYELVRLERVAAGHTTHTTYDDFRTDARGRTRPWHYFGGDERPDTEFDYRLVRDDLDAAVTESDVEIPRDRRTLVDFPAGVDTVKLPAHIVEGRIYVRVTIGGRGLDFLLDSGSAAISIDERVARELKLPVYGRITQTVAGSFASGRVVVPNVAVGPLAMRDVVMHTVPYSTPETHSIRAVGLLGYDFLASAALKIDYASGDVEAARPGTLAFPAGATPLEVRLGSGTPVARATIGEATGDDFIIDTGAAFSYVIFQRFARLHRETLEDRSRESYGDGVGGSFGYRPIETTKVALGAWSLEQSGGVEALAPNAFGFDNQDGLIGAEILRRFTVYFDYAANRVGFSPSPAALQSRSVTPILTEAGARP